MGSCTFQTRYNGKSAQDAYTIAVEDAVSEYGNDPYNGTISTTHGFVDVTKKFLNSKLNMQDFIDKCLDDMSRRECSCIQVKEPKLAKEKVRSTVKNIPTKGTRKWVLKYVVYCWSEPVKSFLNKAEAIAAARKHTESTERGTYILVEKHTLNSRVAEIEYKPSKTEAKGSWIFFGCASE